MNKLFVILVVLAGFAIPVPASAENVTWIWTAPTMGGEVVGYSLEENIDGTGFMVVDDNLTSPSWDTSYENSEIAQVRVRAWNWKSVPLLDANGLLIGKTQVKQYGIYSDYSDPYVSNPNAPGGCSAPTCNPR